MLYKVPFVTSCVLLRPPFPKRREASIPLWRPGKELHAAICILLPSRAIWLPRSELFWFNSFDRKAPPFPPNLKKSSAFPFFSLSRPRAFLILVVPWLILSPKRPFRRRAAARITFARDANGLFNRVLWPVPPRKEAFLHLKKGRPCLPPKRIPLSDHSESRTYERLGYITDDSLPLFRQPSLRRLLRTVRPCPTVDLLPHRSPAGTIDLPIFHSLAGVLRKGGSWFLSFQRHLPFFASRFPRGRLSFMHFARLHQSGYLPLLRRFVIFFPPFLPL